MIWRVVSAVVLLAGLATGLANAQNLVTNFGFESGSVGPGAASPWTRYTFAATPTYYVTSASWAVRDGSKSQEWYSGALDTAGIFQYITSGVSFGQVYQATVSFGDPDTAGMYGPTMFRVGIQPSGAVPNPTNVVWGAWLPVTGSWQQASVTATASAAQITLVLESGNGTTGGPPAYQHGPPYNRVIVDDTKVVAVAAPLFGFIANVPDESQPENANPLNCPNMQDFCAPMAAVNITDYWDVQNGNANALGVDANLGRQTASAYIGYWMDTNDFGCPYRTNGATNAHASGTYNVDIAPGLAQFVRWDNANTFGCNPPARPVGKERIFLDLDRPRITWHKGISPRPGPR